MPMRVPCRSMKESDNNIFRHKESLIKNLEDLVEYLGDEDAKNVSLDNLENASSSMQLDTVSANSEKQEKGELAQSS